MLAFNVYYKKLAATHIDILSKCEVSLFLIYRLYKWRMAHLPLNSSQFRVDASLFFLLYTH